MLNARQGISRAGRWTPTISLIALAALAGCGGGGNANNHLAGASGNTMPVGAAGNTATTGAAGNTATTGAAGTGSVMSGAAGTMGATVAVCTNYCTTIMANCKGQNAQYADMANCLKACGYMQAGSPTDTSGNSAACRTNAAIAATMDTAAVKSKCFQAGPLSYGVCGNDCDLYCTVATSYCPGMAGYKSYDDCDNICGQFGRVLDFGMPGYYNAAYTPGPTPETKDTFECRGYYLFVNALASTANQASGCMNAANVSAMCGPGVKPLEIPDGGTTVSDAAIPTYDGGLVHVINSTTWTETMYPPDKRKMLLRDEGDPHMVMVDLSKTPIQQWKTVAEGPWARAGQLIGNNEILGGTSQGYQVFDYTTGAMKRAVKGFGNTQSAYRMATGETMLTQSGTVLTFLDKNDVKVRQISYPGYGYVRVARPTRKGTFLVPSDQSVFEGDATGKVLWKLSGGAPGWGHIWEPLMLGPPVGGGTWNDGDVILCTAFGSSCDIIDTHMTPPKVTFRYGTKAMKDAATIRPNFFSEFEILPNGNIFCSNWQGHGGGNGGSGIQVLEFDPKGTVVWFWKQDPTIFSSIQGVQVMDGKNPMYLHVQETSPDSTWQPVMTGL